MDASCQKTFPHQPVGVVNEQPEHILVPKKEYLELKWAVGYWQTMHAKAIIREKKLKQKIKEQEGQIRDLRHRLFGKKAEKKSTKKENRNPKDPKNNRPRGQQPGSEGHGLTERPDLLMERGRSDLR